MVIKHEKLHDILSRIVKKIDITDELFKVAEAEYEKLGKYINDKTQDYKVRIYPQGSFALGTVVKPNSDAEEYDLDIVCEFEEDYGFDAKELKFIVKNWLSGYRPVKGNIEEKPRCWHIEYDQLDNFHMDVIPGYRKCNCKCIGINITDKDKNSEKYQYIDSNPEGYANWFFERCKQTSRTLFAGVYKTGLVAYDEAFVEDLKRRKQKTVLQKAIQILKRHRNIMFDNGDEKHKPISILITTLAAQAYQGQGNLYDTICDIIKYSLNIVNSAGQEVCRIQNPSMPEESFTDKWKKDSMYKEQFIKWLNRAAEDFASLEGLDKVSLWQKLKIMLGVKMAAGVFAEITTEENKRGLLLNEKGMISPTGTIKIPRNHHYGEEEEM